MWFPLRMKTAWSLCLSSTLSFQMTPDAPVAPPAENSTEWCIFLGSALVNTFTWNCSLMNHTIFFKVGNQPTHSHYPKCHTLTFCSYMYLFKETICSSFIYFFLLPFLCQAWRQRLRVLLNSFRLRTGIVPQPSELSSWTDLPALGHESVALDKLLSLPERQQLEGAGAGLLLWDNTENEAEEEQIIVCKMRQQTDNLMESIQGDINVDTGADFGKRCEDKKSPLPSLCFPAR